MRNLFNHVSISVGFMSSSDRRVHFGLGPNKKVKELDIRWPSGIQQTLHDLDVDQILTIVEPAK